MDNLIIREAKLNDAEDIAKVHIKIWQQAYKGQIPDDFLENLSVENRTKVWVENISNPKPKQNIFVAESGGKILGFVAVGPNRDKDARKDWGELYAIYVDQQSAGKGVGTSLTQKGLDFLKSESFKQATLWVLVSNTKGRKFYENRGWKAENKIKRDKIGRVEVKEIRYKIVL